MAPPAKKSRSTGPKSALGKAKSSQNAVSHGLTSNRVMPDEVAMVESFAKELTAYYKPESPLEVLQIQRIAFCRAKLAKLIDIEVAGRALERRMIDLDPDRVMDKLIQFSAQIRTVALKSLKGRGPLDVLGMDALTLQRIHQEIRKLGKMIGSPDDLPLCLPVLCEYLGQSSFLPADVQDVTLDQRLMVFVQRIRKLFEPELKLEDKGGFEHQLSQIQLPPDHPEYQGQFRKTRNHRSGAHGYHESVYRDLLEIVDLVDVLSRVPTVMQSYEEMKGWMLRAADLQMEQSERMMKYQTMLERRLSSAIGELLELRKYRFN
jgi:hypothetical protein